MEIGAGVFQLKTSRVSNCFLIKEPVCTLVDCCLPRHEGKIAGALSKHGIGLGDIRRLILTHWHLDHSGSAEALRRAAGMEVYMHPLDVPYVHGERQAAAPAIRVVTAIIRPRMAYGAPLSLLPLTDGQDLGGIQVVHTPGRTPGHVCLLVGGLLLAGDGLLTGDRFRLPPRLLNEDTRIARDSVRKLLNLPFDTAASGHGGPVEEASAKLKRLVATL